MRPEDIEGLFADMMGGADYRLPPFLDAPGDAQARRWGSVPDARRYRQSGLGDCRAPEAVNGPFTVDALRSATAMPDTCLHGDITVDAVDFLHSNCFPVRVTPLATYLRPLSPESRNTATMTDRCQASPI